MYLNNTSEHYAAKRHNIPVAGVWGVLLRPSDQVDLDLETELDAHPVKAGFWISDELYERALEMDSE